METEVTAVLRDINQLHLDVQSQLQQIRAEVSSKIDLEEVNFELRQCFQQYESKLSELRIFAEELDDKKKRDELNQDYLSYKSQLTTLRTALRKANVQCHQRIDNETREALLSGSNLSGLEKSNKNRISMQRQSRDITENLTAVSRLLAEEVKKSERTVESLAGSSNSESSFQCVFLCSFYGSRWFRCF